ncbi:hypothetical protein FQN55_008286 [Onygenales sp. PD_40]|nr:hypothetical protein FQN55_008286 [Onygenales sp. PD_40]KAK2791233.1 hypothetical protein FQN53_006073 [Emmonsiellopsis sp. PD_33]KAK2793858.1 hypothetical protein FQN51_001015 [Onygenales sp. PD_10]
MSFSQPSSYFTLPLAPWQQPASFRVSKYEPRNRGRNHKDVEGYSDDDGTSNGSASDGEASAGEGENESGARSSMILTPNEAHQYRVAGQPFHKELPRGKYPHALPPSDKKGRVTRRAIETELSQLSPPVFTYQPASQTSLRLQHLAVITTILHRCLLEGDYIRAGRAWGLILRDGVRGHNIDPRAGGRWGIGAEILLRSDSHPSATDASARSTGMGYEENHYSQRQWFTRSGFERAKRYYERLALDYPYRKAAPGALGPLDFYPAMYGLWISLVQEESQAAREAALEIGGMDDYDPSADNMSISSDLPRHNNQKNDMIAEARQKELAEAEQIAAELDGLLVSPPYSDSYELLRLRGMISLWIGDLYVSSVSPEENDTSMGGFGDQTMASDDDGQMNSILARMEHGLGMERKTAEVERANGFFGKAKAKASKKQVSVADDGDDMI